MRLRLYKEKIKNNSELYVTVDSFNFIVYYTFKEYVNDAVSEEYTEVMFQAVDSVKNDRAVYRMDAFHVLSGMNIFYSYKHPIVSDNVWTVKILIKDYTIGFG